MRVEFPDSFRSGWDTLSFLLLRIRGREGEKAILNSSMVDILYMMILGLFLYIQILHGCGEASHSEFIKREVLRKGVVKACLS